MAGDVRVEVAGTAVELLPERAVWWPDASTLLVADLHWGKTETFRAAGLPVPGGELDDDLGRLSRALEKTGAKRLVVLGDLVHGRIGVTPAVIARVATWRRSFAGAVLLVRGNHDRHLPVLPEEWGIEEARGVVRDGPFAFVHDAVELPDAFTWCGHEHPTVRLTGRVDSVRLPCFRLHSRVGVLPAFGTFTGGPAIGRRRASDARVYAVTSERVIRLGS
jgi:hypothetical protein